MTDTADSTTDDVRLQGHNEFHRRWWINASMDRDTYDLFVVQYRVLNGRTEEQHYFTNDDGKGVWLPYQEYEVIAPCVRIPGNLVHMLVEEGIPQVDRQVQQDQLGAVFVAIFEQLLTSGNPQENE